MIQHEIVAGVKGAWVGWASTSSRRIINPVWSSWSRSLKDKPIGNTSNPKETNQTPKVMIETNPSQHKGKAMELIYNERQDGYQSKENHGNPKEIMETTRKEKSQKPKEKQWTSRGNNRNNTPRVAVVVVPPFSNVYIYTYIKKKNMWIYICGYIRIHVHI